MRWRDVGSEGFTWGDAWAIVNALTPGSALYIARSPEGRGWKPETYVLADIYDVMAQNVHTLARANGGKGRKPKPYPRPGVQAANAETKVFGYKPMSIPEMRKKLGWDKPDEPTKPRPCCLLPTPCKHRS